MADEVQKVLTPQELAALEGEETLEQKAARIKEAEERRKKEKEKIKEIKVAKKERTETEKQQLEDKAKELAQKFEKKITPTKREGAKKSELSTEELATTYRVFSEVQKELEAEGLAVGEIEAILKETEAALGDNKPQPDFSRQVVAGEFAKVLGDENVKIETGGNETSVREENGVKIITVSEKPSIEEMYFIARNLGPENFTPFTSLQIDVFANQLTQSAAVLYELQQKHPGIFPDTAIAELYNTGKNLEHVLKGETVTEESVESIQAKLKETKIAPSLQDQLILQILYGKGVVVSRRPEGIWADEDMQQAAHAAGVSVGEGIEDSFYANLYERWTLHTENPTQQAFEKYLKEHDYFVQRLGKNLQESFSEHGKAMRVVGEVKEQKERGVVYESEVAKWRDVVSKRETKGTTFEEERKRIQRENPGVRVEIEELARLFQPVAEQGAIGNLQREKQQQRLVHVPKEAQDLLLRPTDDEAGCAVRAAYAKDVYEQAGYKVLTDLTLNHARLVVFSPDDQVFFVDPSAPAGKQAVGPIHDEQLISQMNQLLESKSGSIRVDVDGKRHAISAGDDAVISAFLHNMVANHQISEDVANRQAVEKATIEEAIRIYPDNAAARALYSTFFTGNEAEQYLAQAKVLNPEVESLLENGKVSVEKSVIGTYEWEPLGIPSATGPAAGIINQLNNILEASSPNPPNGVHTDDDIRRLPSDILRFLINDAEQYQTGRGSTLASVEEVRQLGIIAKKLKSLQAEVPLLVLTVADQAKLEKEGSAEGYLLEKMAAVFKYITPGAPVENPGINTILQTVQGAALQFLQSKAETDPSRADEVNHYQEDFKIILSSLQNGHAIITGNFDQAKGFRLGFWDRIRQLNKGHIGISVDRYQDLLQEVRITQGLSFITNKQYNNVVDQQIDEEFAVAVGYIIDKNGEQKPIPSHGIMADRYTKILDEAELARGDIKDPAKKAKVELAQNQLRDEIGRDVKIAVYAATCRQRTSVIQNLGLVEAAGDYAGQPLYVEDRLPLYGDYTTFIKYSAQRGPQEELLKDIERNIASEQLHDREAYLRKIYGRSYHHRFASDEQLASLGHQLAPYEIMSYVDSFDDGWNMSSVLVQLEESVTDFPATWFARADNKMKAVYRDKYPGKSDEEIIQILSRDSEWAKNNLGLFVKLKLLPGVDPSKRDPNDPTPEDVRFPGNPTEWEKRNARVLVYENIARLYQDKILEFFLEKKVEFVHKPDRNIRRDGEGRPIFIITDPAFIKLMTDPRLFGNIADIDIPSIKKKLEDDREARMKKNPELPPEPPVDSALAMEVYKAFFAKYGQALNYVRTRSIHGDYYNERYQAEYRKTHNLQPTDPVPSSFLPEVLDFNEGLSPEQRRDLEGFLGIDRAKGEKELKELTRMMTSLTGIIKKGNARSGEGMIAQLVDENEFQSLYFRTQHIMDLPTEFAPGIQKSLTTSNNDMPRSITNYQTSGKKIADAWMQKVWPNVYTNTMQAIEETKAMSQELGYLRGAIYAAKLHDRVTLEIMKAMTVDTKGVNAFFNLLGIGNAPLNITAITNLQRYGGKHIEGKTTDQLDEIFNKSFVPAMYTEFPKEKAEQIINRARKLLKIRPRDKFKRRIYQGLLFFLFELAVEAVKGANVLDEKAFG